MSEFIRSFRLTSPNLMLMLLTGVWSSLTTVQLNAREADEQTREMVVTPSRIALPRRQIATSVSILSKEEIEAHGNVSMLDILRQMPSVAASSNGGPGKASSLRIRGEEGFRTLVIIDGIRLLDPSLPRVGPQTEHLLSSGISRVEVLRGPQGLAYGADAGGVVNLSSARVSEGFVAELDARAGAFNTQQSSGSIGAGNDAGNIYLSATDFSTGGFNSRVSDTQLRDDDGYDNLTVHARGALNVSDELRLELVHRSVEGRSEYDGCYDEATFSTVDNCDTRYELDASRAALSHASGDFSHSLSYNLTRTVRQDYTQGQATFGSRGELSRVEYSGSTRGLPGFDLVWGADWEEADFDDAGRHNLGAYLEYLSDFSDSVFLTAGVRHDENEDVGANTTYRLSAAHVLEQRDGSRLKYRASYGTGLRAPSPYEIFYNDNSVTPPAAGVNLRQETSRGHEFGIEYLMVDRHRFEAVYFSQDVEDAIYYDLDTFSGYLQGIGTSSSKGIELSADIALGSTLDMKASYTHNETERPDGQQRLRRPEHLANIGISYYPVSQLTFNGFLRVSRDSIDEVNGEVVALDDFEVLDLSARYRFTDALEVYARLENALDEDYREVRGFYTAERAAYIGFNMTFGNR